MLSVLRHPVYARLFAAQVVALLGTGLLTVALGLLAYDLAGERAGSVLGTALTIKMVAYVGLAPVANALAERLPRQWVLVGADLLRAGVALALPFVDAVGQIYVAIFVLQAASATFTPAFQATIPDVLGDERAYTRALSLSRLAYDLESLASPALAGLVLTVTGYHWLFTGTVAGFLASALLVRSARVPPRRRDATARPFAERLSRGVRIYLATPRLRGLLALTLAAASAGAFVIVDTVVLVRAGYGGTERDVATALAAFGAGSMAVALMLPRLLERVAERRVMVLAGAALAALVLAQAWARLSGAVPAWWAFLALWAATGALCSGIQTPGGRLLRRSAHPEDRPALFAAHFALSHACWLVAYPLAGPGGEALGLGGAMLALGLLAAAGAAAAIRLWPSPDREVLPHTHPGLPAGHPHIAAHTDREGRHAHTYVIDDDHRAWPGHG